MKNTFKMTLPHISSNELSPGLTRGLMATGILMLFMMSDLPANCQGNPNATLSAKGALQIPAEQPLSATYIFDLSKYKFNSDADLIDFLSTRSSEFFSVRANTANKQGILILHLNGHPNWTIAEWNKYLMEATVAHPIKPE